MSKSVRYRLTVNLPIGEVDDVVEYDNPLPEHVQGWVRASWLVPLEAPKPAARRRATTTRKKT